MKTIIIAFLLSIVPTRIEYHEQLKGITIQEVKVTYDIVDAYCYIPSDSSYTANSTLITRQRRWIAVSRDLLEKYPFNSSVLVAGINKYNGIWVVKDLMSDSHSKSIDFMIIDTLKYKIDSWKSIRIKKLDRT